MIFGRGASIVVSLGFHASNFNWKLIFKCLAVTTFILWDPFGFSEATNRYAQSIISRVYAPTYDRLGQDHVSAVVISDEAAERLGGYPLRFDVHAKALRRIMCLDPAAVLIDLNFRSTRGDTDGISALAEALSYRQGPSGCGPASPEALKGDTVAPVLLAIVRNDTAQCRSILDSGKAECAAMSPFQSILDLVRPVDVTHLLTDNQLYELVTKSDAGPSASPAVMMAQALCRRSPGISAFCADGTSQFEAPLLVRWGEYVSPLSASRLSPGTCGPASNAVTSGERWSSAAMSLFKDFVWRDFDTPVQPCLYTDQASVSDFMALDVNSNPYLAQLIKNRIVIYGADITALPDRFISPVHGSVPGLFVHAMATDNLLTQGRDYWHPAPTVAGFDSATFLEIFFTIAVLFVATLCTTWWSLIAATGAIALLIFIVALAWTSLLAFAPLNFALVFIVGLVNLILDGPNEASK